MGCEALAAHGPVRRLSPAAGWACVGAVVLTAELLGTKTLSEAFRATSRHPVYGPVVFTTWAVLTLHLFGALPKRYDPFCYAVGFVTRNGGNSAERPGLV